MQRFSPAIWFPALQRTHLVFRPMYYSMVLCKNQVLFIENIVFLSDIFSVSDTCRFIVLQHQFAGNIQLMDTFIRLKRIQKIGVVTDGVVIKQHKISIAAFPDKTFSDLIF